MAQSPSSLAPEEGATPAQANPKVVVSALVLIGLAALILGTFRVLDTIRAPFDVTQQTSDATGAQAEEEQRLKTRDTDQDGLSDYDELNVSSTSPFLADSDSDGADDRAEVLAQTNPNCPQGQDCSPLPSDGNVNAGPTNAAPATNLGAAALRQTLKEAGAPAYLVDATDDASLLKLYEDTVGPTNTNTDSVNLLRSLQGLSAADMRQLLEGAGADPALLQQVDDASLKAIFDSALAEELRASPP